MSWFSEEEQKLVTNWNVLDEVLDRLFNKAVERALTLMPHTVASLLKYAANIDTVQTEFMKDNQDLVEHKDRLKELVGSVSSEHPDWDISKTVDEAGKDLRKEIKTISNIGAMDLTSLEAPRKVILDVESKEN